MKFVGQLVGSVANVQLLKYADGFLICLNSIGKLQKLRKRVIGVQIKVDPVLFKALSGQFCVAVTHSGRDEKPVSGVNIVGASFNCDFAAACKE